MLVPQIDLPAEYIEGARLVLDDRLEIASLRIEAGRITGIDVARDGATRIPARGLTLAPAFVDIHGDAFERQLMPRPGVPVPLDLALMETDRQLAANGIATAYHALTLGWEPGLRNLRTARQLVEALDRLQPRLTAENRLQLRWETFCPEAEPLIIRALDLGLCPALAFNDHTSPAMLPPEIAVQDRPFDHVPDYPQADPSSPDFARRLQDRASRSQMTPAAYAALLATVWQRRPDVPAQTARIAALARTRGAPMLSHDDTQPETRGWYRSLGARIAEFPMNQAAARAARDGGDWIVLGAPNAMRGGSHLGSAAAAPMIAGGLCDILASDYFHPAMLGAMARLSADSVAPLPALWQLVAANPAAALGLSDRGRIAPGLRADLVLLDWPDQGMPAPRRTWVSGRAGYSALSRR
ncbi:MAG: alpha-D-ribose 1-methylphosphonate 5-triphosphate diphosphatase [Paracoccaceae bacterium]